MATAFKVLKDYAAGFLETGIDSDDTSLTLENGQGASFPSTFPYWVTLFTTDPGLGCEVVEVGGRSGDTLQSLVRGQEGTSAAAWSAGTNVRAMIMSQHLGDLQVAVNTLETGLDLGQTTEFLGTFEPTESMKIWVNGVQYRVPLDPV